MEKDIIEKLQKKNRTTYCIQARIYLNFLCDILHFLRQATPIREEFDTYNYTLKELEKILEGCFKKIEDLSNNKKI